MSLGACVQRNLTRSIDLYEELVSTLPEPSLTSKLPDLRSNTVGQQLWCVVGARESYARAIEVGEWAGFSCSLDAARITSRRSVRDALVRSGARVRDVVGDLASFDDARHQLVLDLLEHEAAHQGQLIRYLYALRLPIPDGWKSRYALDD